MISTIKILVIVVVIIIYKINKNNHWQGIQLGFIIRPSIKERGIHYENLCKR